MGKVTKGNFGDILAPVDQVEEMVTGHMYAKPEEEAKQEKLYCEIGNNTWLMVACCAMALCAGLFLALFIKNIITWIALVLA